MMQRRAFLGPHGTNGHRRERPMATARRVCAACRRASGKRKARLRSGFWGGPDRSERLRRPLSRRRSRRWQSATPGWSFPQANTPLLQSDSILMDSVDTRAWRYWQRRELSFAGATQPLRLIRLQGPGSSRHSSSTGVRPPFSQGVVRAVGDQQRHGCSRSRLFPSSGSDICARRCSALTAQERRRVATGVNVYDLEEAANAAARRWRCAPRPRTLPKQETPSSCPSAECCTRQLRLDGCEQILLRQWSSTRRQARAVVLSAAAISPMDTIRVHSRIRERPAALELWGRRGDRGFDRHG